MSEKLLVWSEVVAAQHQNNSKFFMQQPHTENPYITDYYANQTNQNYRHPASDYNDFVNPSIPIQPQFQTPLQSTEYQIPTPPYPIFNNNSQATFNYPIPDAAIQNKKHAAGQAEAEKVRDVIMFLEKYFTLLKDRFGMLIFIQNQTNRLFLVSQKQLFETIKSYIYYTYNYVISKNSIQDALEIVSGRNNSTLFEDLIIDSRVLFFENETDKMALGLHVAEDNPQNFFSSSRFLQFFNSKTLIENKVYYRSIYFKNIDYMYLEYPRNQDLKEYFNAQIDAFFDLINPIDNQAKILVLTWLISCLIPKQSCFALELAGPANSGKKTLLAILQSFIDPSLRTYTPILSTVKALQSQLLDQYLMCFSAVNTINPAVQHELTRLLSGDVFNLKQTPLNLDLNCFMRRPLLIHAPFSVITEPNLLQKSITIWLDPIDKPVDDYFGKILDEQLPKLNGIFTAFIDLAIAVIHLQLDAGTKISNDSMQSFKKIGYKISLILGKDPKEFFNSYYVNYFNRIAEQIHDHPVAIAILEWAKVADTPKTLAVGEWLETLKTYQPAGTQWPENAKAFGLELSRLQTLLRTQNILCQRIGKRGSNCQWTLARVAPSSV